MISKENSTAATPRAHITNAACLECLRDVGLESAVIANATGRENMQHTRFCDTFLGEEYGRLYSWGNVSVHSN